MARLLISTATSKTFLYILLYTLLPAAASLGVPVMTIAVKRYTPAASRSLAYGLFYTVMNVAALASGFVVDGLRAFVCTAPADASRGGTAGMLMHDSNRLVVASGALTSAVAFGVALFLSRAVEAEALERGCAEARGAWGRVDGGDGEEGSLFEVPAHAGQLIRHELHSQTAGVNVPYASAHACTHATINSMRWHSWSCPQLDHSATKSLHGCSHVGLEGGLTVRMACGVVRMALMLP